MCNKCDARFMRRNYHKSLWARINYLRYIKKTLIKQQNNNCAYCSRVMGPRGSTKDHSPSCEHILPRTWGGCDCPENLICICIKCNHKRAETLLLGKERVARIIQYKGKSSFLPLFRVYWTYAKYMFGIKTSRLQVTVHALI